MRVNGVKCVFAAMMATLTLGAQATQTRTESKTETRVESKAIPFRVVYEFSRTVGPGRLKKTQQGHDGLAIKTFSVTLKNGKPVSKELVSTERKDPKDEIILMGVAANQTSRHGTRFSRKKTLTMSATAYDGSPQTVPGTTGRTATGVPAKYGVVAVDPRVIPLGTLMYIEGYGFAVAADTGGAIKGNRIDLCYDKRSQSEGFGRKKVIVHILRKA